MGKRLVLPLCLLLLLIPLSSSFDYAYDLCAQRFAFTEHGAGAGVDSVREQKKLEARKMPVNRAESHKSTARFVGQLPANKRGHFARAICSLVLSRYEPIADTGGQCAQRRATRIVTLPSIPIAKKGCK